MQNIPDLQQQQQQQHHQQGRPDQIHYPPPNNIVSNQVSKPSDTIELTEEEKNILQEIKKIQKSNDPRKKQLLTNIFRDHINVAKYVQKMTKEKK